VVLFPLALIWLVVIVIWAIRSRPAEPTKPPDERGCRRLRGPRRGPDRGPVSGAAKPSRARSRRVG
jgi:hypothetical protein